MSSILFNILLESTKGLRLQIYFTNRYYNHKTWKQQLHYLDHLPHFTEVRPAVIWLSGGKAWTRTGHSIFRWRFQSCWRVAALRHGRYTAPAKKWAIRTLRARAERWAVWCYLLALTLVPMSDTKSLLPTLWLRICGSNNWLLPAFYRWLRHFTLNLLETKYYK